MEKGLFRIEFASYHKWNDFGFNLLPVICFTREDDEDGLCRTLGIGWLCWSIVLVW